MAVRESAQTAQLSVTHAPIGKGGTNWITKSKPGNAGQLPAYIQNVRNAIMRDGTDESRATAIAIGRVRDWAEGKGNVSPEVRAAAAKAIAEFDKMRAKSKVTESVSAAVRGVLEAKPDDGDGAGDGDGDAKMPTVFCVKCRGKRKPTDKMKCPKCGTDLSKAVAQSRKVSEGVLEALGGSFEEAHPRGRGGQWVAKQGASGQAVSSIQAQVGTTVDGQYGNQTRQAVIAFQRKHGLQVDGKVGAQTVAAMRGNKNAAGVTPGGMTATDRAWLLKQLVKT